jgi:methylthioribose-1-phosphate isomerase
MLLRRGSFLLPGIGTQLVIPIEWTPKGKIRFIDQTRLPHKEVWVETGEYGQVAEAIKTLRVRGAPLIGIAAAYGLALAAQSIGETDAARFMPRLQKAAEEISATRPTAVNLTWALGRVLAACEGIADVDQIRLALRDEAIRIHDEDIEANRRLGANGAGLLRSNCRVLTHCNAGALATGGYGTALGVIRSAHEQGKLAHVYATETRPLLQGARLTAWELRSDGVPFTLIADSAAGSIMRRRLVDAVVVGADRIAANGDVANKIGTYSLAVLAGENGVPFYVAAPTSTLDLSLSSGKEIPIEERSPDEVTAFGGMQTAPKDANAVNPAFDVTASQYVAAIITEHGVARAPYNDSLPALFEVEAVPHG